MSSSGQHLLLLTTITVRWTATVAEVARSVLVRDWQLAVADRLHARCEMSIGREHGKWTRQWLIKLRFHLIANNINFISGNAPTHSPSEERECSSRYCKILFVLNFVAWTRFPTHTESVLQPSTELLYYGQGLRARALTQDYTLQGTTRYGIAYTYTNVVIEIFIITQVVRNYEKIKTNTMLIRSTTNVAIRYHHRICDIVCW